MWVSKPTPNRRALSPGRATPDRTRHRPRDAAEDGTDDEFGGRIDEHSSRLEIRNSSATTSRRSVPTASKIAMASAVRTSA
ncbi:hypothetical protein C486_01479 [Natrinema gari JCM 14663]|uniref:Uncharacterized protein n=1 Tax=Natrinema gari JCM 14663 TaxID=1230459 RepID=L9ZBS4_9EURY|nr:hypothetical protein C486_01479 [Natrinema gari JCM 14663]